jgi:hypothetical protein
VLDLPGRIPLPAKITVQVLDPVELSDDVDAAYDELLDTMQEALDELARERTLPVVG